MIYEAKVPSLACRLWRPLLRSKPGRPQSANALKISHTSGRVKESIPVKRSENERADSQRSSLQDPLSEWDSLDKRKRGRQLPAPF